MQAGDRLGEYVLIDRLGEGGFGEVWRAENPDLPGAVVAVKVPTKPDCAVALRREGALQNVVRTLTVNAAHDPPYLVSEYVPGESLRRRLDRVKRMTPRDAIEVLVQVLAALGAAHRAGLVHRDVKPENVLLGPDGVAKLSDFGLGRITESVTASIALSRGRSLTEGGGVVGTFFYMSPEQMKGQPVDLRSDLYACGVMLYEMLTGEAHPIRLPVAGVSRAISGVVDQALHTNPDLRFQSALQMCSSLEAAVQAPASFETDVVAAPSRSAVPSPRMDAVPAAQPVGPYPRPPRRFPFPAVSCGVPIAMVVAAIGGGIVFMSMRRQAAMRSEAEARMAADEARMRAEADWAILKDPVLLDPSGPVLVPLPAGVDSNWDSTLRQAEEEIENEEFERAEAELRKAIARAGAGADCNETVRPRLRDAYYLAARAQARLGDLDAAFVDLRRAVELGLADQLRVRTEPDLVPLRNDRRWKDLLDRMNR